MHLDGNSITGQPAVSVESTGLLEFLNDWNRNSCHNLYTRISIGWWEFSPPNADAS